MHEDKQLMNWLCFDTNYTVAIFLVTTEPLAIKNNCRIVGRYKYRLSLLFFGLVNEALKIT